jgi:hypothetical protein
MNKTLVDDLRASVHPLSMVYRVTKDGKCLPGLAMPLCEVREVFQETYKRNHTPSGQVDVFRKRNFTGDWSCVRFLLMIAYERLSLIQNVSVTRELEGRTLGASSVSLQFPVFGTAIVWVADNPNFVSGLVPPGRPDEMQLSSLIQFTIEQNNDRLHQDGFQFLSGP